MRQGNNWFSLFVIFLAALGGILYGYDLGIIAGALLFIQQSIPMSEVQSSLLVSAVLGGGSIATLISGPLADSFGRRAMIIAAACIFLLGVLALSFAQQYSTILIGRLTQGVGIGIITLTIPLYLAESLPKEIRGRGMTVFQLLLTLGIALASIVGLYFTPTENWRAMFLSAGLPGVVLLVSVFFLPNSPHWLLAKKSEAEALRVLCLSRTPEQAKNELAAMKKLNIHRTTHLLTLFKNLWNPHYRYPLLIVFIIAALQQLTGINSILQFSAYILQQAGLESNINAMFGNLAIASVNFTVTLLALLLIDRLGRKKLLAFGTGGMGIFLVYLGCIYCYCSFGVLKGILLLTGLLGFIFTYAIGPGVVVWLLLSELLPSPVRSTGMAIALFINSLMSAIFAAFFITLVHHIGYSGVFLLCGGFSFIYFIIAYYMLPETSHKTLEEITIGWKNPIADLSPLHMAEETI